MKQALKFIYVSLALTILCTQNSEAQCTADLKGSTTLLCEFSQNGSTELLQELEGGSTKKVNRKKIKKSLREDKKLLKRTKKEISQLNDNLVTTANSSIIDSETLDILTRTENTLENFGNPTELLENTTMEDLTTEQAHMIGEQMESEVRKTQQQIHLIERETNTKIAEMFRDPKGKNFKKVCKRKKNLQELLCTSEISCGDGVDDDSDGFTDCDDQDCLGKKGCPDCGAFAIPGELVIISAYNKNDVTKCSTVALVQWSDEDDEGATNWEVHITSGGIAKSDVVSPPFNDTFTRQNIEYSAPEGSHWDMLGSGSSKDGAGTNPVSCSNYEDSYRELFTNPYVTISVCQ